MRANGMVMDLLDLGEDAPGWTIVEGFAPCSHGFCALLGRPSGPDVPVMEWGAELDALEPCLDAPLMAWEKMISTKAKG